LLHENILRPHSARLSVQSIFKRLRDEEGFTGTYRTLQDYVRSVAPSTGCVGQNAFDLLVSLEQKRAGNPLFLAPHAQQFAVPRDYTRPILLEADQVVSIARNPDDRVHARQAAFEWMHAVLQNKVSRDALCREVGNVSGFESLLERLYDGRLSDRNRAMVVLASRCGLSKSVICRFLRIDRKTGRRYLRIFEKGGEAALFARQTKSHRKFDNEAIKQEVFGLLHQPPSNYGINRTTWIMADLVRVLKESGKSACSHVIRKIIKAAGYRWRKARVVLTSTDPDYSQKLACIQMILSGLRLEEAFFSIDEFGPFSVKMKPGYALNAPGEQRVVPQWQESRGCLIMTAALELSSNQVTHFYSARKNTAEMIRMLELLVERYNDRSKLYLSSRLWPFLECGTAVERGVSAARRVHWTASRYAASRPDASCVT
jgi:transposase